MNVDIEDKALLPLAIQLFACCALNCYYRAMNCPDCGEWERNPTWIDFDDDDEDFCYARVAKTEHGLNRAKEFPVRLHSVLLENWYENSDQPIIVEFAGSDRYIRLVLSDIDADRLLEGLTSIRDHRRGSA